MKLGLITLVALATMGCGSSPVSTSAFAPDDAGVDSFFSVVSQVDASNAGDDANDSAVGDDASDAWSCPTGTQQCGVGDQLLCCDSGFVCVNGVCTTPVDSGAPDSGCNCEADEQNCQWTCNWCGTWVFSCNYKLCMSHCDQVEHDCFERCEDHKQPPQKKQPGSCSN